MTKNKIPLKSLAQYKHVKFLIATEKQALVAYKFVMLKLQAEIKRLMRKEKLAKSEDPTDGLEPGWTSEIPTIEVNLDELLGKTLDKYLNGLKWVMMGKAAGAQAAKDAEAIGLKGKVTPGIVHAAYLQSIDAHSQHYEDVTGQDAPEMPIDLVKASFDQIAKRVNRFIDQTLSQLKTDMLVAIDKTVDAHNYKTLTNAHQEAHDLLPEVGAEQAATDAAEGVSAILRGKAVTEAINEAADKFEAKFDLAVKTDLGMASAAGTHQALVNIYGTTDDNVKVINVEMEDERVCNFCHKISKNPDGSWIKYRIDELQASGYNYGRKKADWKVSVSPQHHQCRCATVYLPIGFEADDHGGIYKK